MGPLLVVSKNPEDIKLGKVVALGNSLQYLETTDPAGIRRLLEQTPNAMVLWDFDALDKQSDFLDFFAKVVRPSNSIAITDQGLASYPQITQYPFFGTHIQRRYAEPALTFYSRFVAANSENASEGLAPYFVPNTKVSRIVLKHSSHKKMAIEALQNTLTNKGIKGRIATLVAQCTDELLMNAIFDAPFSPQDRTRPRHNLARDKEFEMNVLETVTMEIAACAQYIGICVRDQYGSLGRAGVFSALRAYFTKEAKTDDALLGPVSGFGLNGIVQSGVNLRIFCQAGKRTETMIFFPVIESFREFRTSFRFFSLIVNR